jgi:hypothetical protein
VNGVVGRKAQEVGMQRTVRNRVERNVLGQRADGLAADGELDDRVEEVAGAKRLDQFLFPDVDRGRISLPP